MSRLAQEKRRITEGIKGVWYRFDESFLKVHFGGEKHEDRDHHHHNFGASNGDGASSWNQSYEMRTLNGKKSPTRNKANGVSRNGFEEDDDDFGDEEMISLTSSFDKE